MSDSISPISSVVWADPAREHAFQTWLTPLAVQHGLELSTLRPASADASFRRYLRLDRSAGGSLIVMDAPPDKENCTPFVQVQGLMQQSGLNVPAILDWNSLQDRMFANFNTIQTPLLLPAGILLLLGGGFFWRRRHVLDVLALGRDAAINLGLDYRRQVLQLLLVVCTMVAVSTALVGPVTFFGLLVANMAYQWMGTRRHAWVLPAVLLWGTVLLLGGQVVLERVLGFNSALSVVVEFVGGLVFIALLMRRGKQ